MMQKKHNFGDAYCTNLVAWHTFFIFEFLQEG